MKSLGTWIFSIILSLVAGSAFAEMPGTYQSEANCTLNITKIDVESGYADGIYKLRSDGVGSCEWTGVGVAKRTHLEIGLVSGSLTSFADVNWVFGPAGDKVEIIYYDTDGKVRNKESFTRKPS